MPSSSPLRAEVTAKNLKILLVCSSGGHLTQLISLAPWWSEHERHWVTFDTEDAVSKLEGERVTFAHSPTTRNVVNLLRNARLALHLLRRESPDVIVSTGAGAAVPFFWLRRFAGPQARTVYLEVIDRVDSPTLTGRLCRPVTDLFCVQWPEQQRFYRGSVLLGKVW
ncbi:UDP-N-acetylglucosamine--LPS N-acetylglucosamine transferase [Nocardioides jishulii]|uniref:UDP-N-acetylglucosamine--LPS N-acetylglucosamine transferase n=1 Tax=Nocardioides jishulii TaxID=2575440 RepID=UPI001EF09525|nr:UDP-N-acetylglucosamine--LPS N-acetylglucosamine transferase [Nocardioides jishulii]